MYIKIVDNMHISAEPYIETDVDDAGLTDLSLKFISAEDNLYMPGYSGGDYDENDLRDTQDLLDIDLIDDRLPIGTGSAPVQQEIVDEEGISVSQQLKLNIM